MKSLDNDNFSSFQNGFLAGLLILLVVLSYMTLENIKANGQRLERIKFQLVDEESTQ